MGVRVTPMPESSASLMLPVFLVSCCDWAVMIISNPGNLVWSGILPGAVYVAGPVVCSLERVPRVPSAGQFAGVGGVAAVPGIGVGGDRHGCLIYPGIRVGCPLHGVVCVGGWPTL